MYEALSQGCSYSYDGLSKILNIIEMNEPDREKYYVDQ